MKCVKLYTWSPPPGKVSRADLIRDLPPEWAKCVTQATPKKLIDAVRVKLPAFLDRALANAGEPSRQSGESWSVVTSAAGSLDRTSGHVAAISVRLTSGGQSVGDYARSSLPKGEVIVDKDANLITRGPQWFGQAVKQCERSVQGVINNTELLKVWRAILKGHDAWSWAKLAWFVPGHKAASFEAVRSAFRQRGATVPCIDVTLGLGGDNEAEVVESLFKHAFETMQALSQRAITASDDQDDYFDPTKDRKQGIRLGALHDNHGELQSLRGILDSLTEVVEESRLYMGIAFSDLRDAAHNLEHGYGALCSIDRKADRVPGHVRTTAQKVMEMTSACHDDLLDEVFEDEPETSESSEPEAHTEAEASTDDVSTTDDLIDF